MRRDNDYSIVTAAKPSHTNSLAVHEDGTDFSYMSELKFGSGGKPILMLIDTGAANTWVMGSRCTSKACVQHNTFGTADSDSMKTTGKPFNLTYGTGSVSGEVVQDIVMIAVRHRAGYFHNSLLQIEHHSPCDHCHLPSSSSPMIHLLICIMLQDMPVSLSFGVASMTSNDFLAYPMDGILGLGRPASNAMEYSTAMEAIQDMGKLQSNVFGVHIQRSSGGSADGELNFGAPDSTRYTGGLSYTDTVRDGTMWEIPIDDAGFNGTFCHFEGKSAIVDTGTSYNLLPPVDAKKLHSQIPHFEQNGEVFNIPCSTKTPIGILHSRSSFSRTFSYIYVISLAGF